MARMRSFTLRVFVWTLCALGFPVQAQERPFELYPAHLKVESRDPGTGAQVVVFSVTVRNRTSQTVVANMRDVEVVDSAGERHRPFKIVSESSGDAERDLTWGPGHALGANHRLHFRLPAGRTIRSAVLLGPSGAILGSGGPWNW